MSVYDLFGNQATAWGTGSTTTGAYQYATAFSSVVGGGITAIRWRRMATTADRKPSTLKIWDTTNQTLIYSASSIPDNGSVGWQQHNLAEPIVLLAGRVYRVSMYWPDGSGEGFLARADVQDAPYPLQFHSNIRAYQLNADTYAPTTDNLYVHPIAVLVDTSITGSGEPGASPGDVENSLAGWLSTTDYTHSDSAPIQTLAAVTDGDTGLGAIAGLLGDALGAGWASATDTLHQIGTKVGSILTAVTTGPLPGITGLEDLANTIIDKLDAAATFLQNPTAGWPGAASGRQVFPATGWTMVDEVDFTFQKSWDVPADLYVLTVSTFPVDIVDVDVDGAHWRPRLGWWAQRNGDGFGARSFVDWETSYLQDGGRRMNGVVIRTQPACDCHVQAWVLA